MQVYSIHRLLQYKIYQSLAIYDISVTTQYISHKCNISVSVSEFLNIEICLQVGLQQAVATQARLIRRQLHRFSSMYTPAIIKKFQTPSSIDTQCIYTIQHIYISQHIYILQSISQSSILYQSIK